MRTSLHKIKSIEEYLLQKGSISERLLMESYLQINDELVQDVRAQQKVYALAKLYGRNKLKNDIQQAEAKVFSDKRFNNFQSIIKAIFNK